MNNPIFCDRYVTPDGFPLIGKDEKYNNLYYNTGHGFLGYTSSCGGAKLITDIIQDKKTNIDLSSSRFDLF